MKTRLRAVQNVTLTYCLLLLANVPGLRQVVANAPLRTDTDTTAILDAMREAGGLTAWWRWFTGDWFLHNGFYRPTTCLSLLIDYSLYGETDWGYRLTNWLLAVLTAIGFYAIVQWFARRWLSHVFAEERQIRLFALVGAVTLSLQQTDALPILRRISAWWLIALWIASTFSCAGRREAWKVFLRNHWWRLGLAAGAFFWSWDRAVHSGFDRLIVWVPSRTALLSSCLSVWSLWSTIRWGDTGRCRFLLAASLLYAGAVGAYEQPLMMVPVVVVLAMAMRRDWKRRAWAGFATLAVIAAGYLALRFALLPSTLSGYQQQQLRSDPALGILHFAQTLLPVWSHFRYWKTVGLNPYLFFFKDAWDILIADLAFAGVLVALWRSWRWFGWWLLWQGMTYLPMSLLHPFEHYYYLPQIGQNAVDLALMAWGWKYATDTLSAWKSQETPR